MDRRKVKILFVCHGNICRSPMAEFVMKHKVAEMFGTYKNDTHRDSDNNLDRDDRDCGKMDRGKMDRDDMNCGDINCANFGNGNLTTANFLNGHNESRREFVYSDLTALDFEIHSAATSTEEIGNPVYPPAKRMLNAHGIDCNGHAARQMTQRDYDYYDYVVLMDRNNLRNLRWNLNAETYAFEIGKDPHSAVDFGKSEKRRKKISLLMDWTKRPGDVADPWYTGDFEATWRDVNEGCDGLLKAIISQ